jgi:beta-glucosidase
MHLKIYILVLAVSGFSTFSSAQSKSQKDMDSFITSLMKKMTLDEKIGQLNLPTGGSFTSTGPVASQDVEEKIRKGEVGGVFSIYTPAAVRKEQDVALHESRLHIPLLIGLDVIHGHKTIFPIPLGMSCSWDTALIASAAHIAATEASADGVNWVFSPMVDIARDPRWGRASEGSGEDPYLGSLIAAAIVRAYQGSSLQDSNTVMACVKHFALYGAVEGGREYNSVDMSPLKMYQYYLAPYRAAIDAGAGSIMTSFNDINGMPSTANHWLLTDLLRKQWGFKGLVVSDYTSVSELTNHGLGDLQTVSALALNAGTDMDMVSEGYLTTMAKSLKEGKVTQADIDRACRLILEAKYKLGLFKDPYNRINEARAAGAMVTPSSRDTARKVAEHSCVLLKNANHTLPLSKTVKIALVGPLADDQADMMGTWVLAGDPAQVISIRKGLELNLGAHATIQYARGSDITDDSFLLKKLVRYHLMPPGPPQHSNAAAMIREALQAAAKANVIVAVLGEAASMSGEAASRSDIGLPSCQEALIHALVATGKPVVLVLVNGRPLTLAWEDSHCAAILETWAAGTEAGNAIADILFGNYNPSGKLTMSFPISTGQIPVYYNHKNTGRPFDPDNKYTSQYLDLPNEPLYPFGYGLSYTSFSYGDLHVDHALLKGNQQAMVTVTVTNTGKYAGEETVQLYLSQPVASLTRSVEDLKGFKKIFLQPGASTEVSFVITTTDLSYYHMNLNYDWDPGKFIVRIGPNSRDLTSTELVWTK